MLGGRVFTNRFAAVSVQNIQDLLGYLAAANKMALIEEIEIGPADPTPTAAMNLQMSIYVMNATVTTGSGGSSNAAQIADANTPVTPGLLASTGTCWQNATVQATTTNQRTQIYPLGCYLFTGYARRFEPGIVLLPGEACVWTLDAALPAAAKLSAWMKIREMGNA
jgi:hypothetical protein